MAKAPRVQNIQTPGVDQADAADTADTDESLDGGAAAELSTAEPEGPALAPDLEALVAREVAKALSKNKVATARAKPAELPTQEAALEQVNADPKRRAVLSKDGWVTASEPTQAPFAKA